MKTVLLPMVGYRTVPQDGIHFVFFTNWTCYTNTITNLNTYPQAFSTPVNTGGSGGTK